MRLGWLDATLIKTGLRWLTLCGLGVLSPVRGLTDSLLAPYLHLGDPSQWTAEMTKLLSLPPDTLQFKLLPVLLTCVAANIIYLLFCQSLVNQLSRRIKQAFQPTETPSA
jgi:hypothetical protein